MLIGYCIAVPLIGTTIAYLPLYLDGLGATPLIIGFAIGFPEFIALILRIPGGYLGDAYGRKFLTVRMNFVLGLISVLIAFAPSWEVLFTLLVVRAMAGFYMPAEYALLADSIPERLRSSGYGLFWTIVGAVGLGGPIFGGLLYESMGLNGLRLGWLIFGSADMIKAVYYQFFLRETLSDQPAKTGVWHIIATSYRDAAPRLVSILRNRSLSVVVALGMLGISINALASTYLILYFTRVLGFSAVLWGSIISVARGITLLLQTPVGILSDRIGRRAILSTFITASGASLILLSFPSLSLEAVSILTFTTFAASLVHGIPKPILDAALIDWVPEAERARLIGIILTIWGVTAFPSNLAWGYAYGFSPPQAFLIGGIIALATLPLLLARFREVRSPR